MILQSYLFLGYSDRTERLRPLAGDHREGGGGRRPGRLGGLGQAGGGAYAGSSTVASTRAFAETSGPFIRTWSGGWWWKGYGKVLGRPGLDLATRELCIVALLAVLRTPRQLYSHLRGALNAGAPPPEMEEVL